MTNTKKIIIFGNAGSGKSTLAIELATKYTLQHLDLDILAWENTNPPTRKPLSDSSILIKQFLDEHEQWVIEGCYADLLSLTINNATEIIFLNPGIDVCVANCKKRPFEPHKYESIEKQNANLTMLIDWVTDYPNRKDEFSLVAHQEIFNLFERKKTEYKSYDRNLVS